VHLSTSQAKPSQAKPSQAKPSQAKHYNSFIRYFVMFITFNLSCLTNIYADQIKVGGFGGVNGQIQNKVWFEVYQKQSAHTIESIILNGDISKIRKQIAIGKDLYNLVELNSIDVTRACDEGLLERISFAEIGFNTKSLLNGATNACGVGFVVFSTVLAYNQNHVAHQPQSWADFWDVTNIPGKRGLQKTALYNLEFALMADGVPAQDVYKVLATTEGQNQAFAKLDQIKPYIEWWESNNSILQKLTNGEVVMTSSFSGRITSERDKQGINFIWTDAIYDMDYWAIPKNSSNQDAVKDFIKFTLQVENQVAFISAINYGATNRLAMNDVAPELKIKLPTDSDNLSKQLAIDLYFWVDHGNELEKRFNDWLNQ